MKWIPASEITPEGGREYVGKYGKEFVNSGQIIDGMFCFNSVYYEDVPIADEKLTILVVEIPADQPDQGEQGELQALQSAYKIEVEANENCRKEIERLKKIVDTHIKARFDNL